MPDLVTVQFPEFVALLPAVITNVFALVNETTENVPSVAEPEVKSTVIESSANNWCAVTETVMVVPLWEYVPVFTDSSLGGVNVKEAWSNALSFKKYSISSLAVSEIFWKIKL